MATRVAPGTSWPCLLSANLSNLRASFTGSPTSSMGTDTTAGLYGYLFSRRERVKNTHLKRIDGTSALSSSGQLEAELMKDCWDARNIPGLWYAPHRSDHFVSFEGVPETFRPIVKHYVKFQLTVRRAPKPLPACTHYLRTSFT